MIGASFDAPPEEAIEYFNSLGVQQSGNWSEIASGARNDAFSFAKLASLDVLQDTRNELERALAEGVPFGEFKKNFRNILAKHGWSGVKETIDTTTFEITSVKFDDPWRMRTIYRTNMQNAYSAGHYKTQIETIEAFPYGEYDAVGDRRTRPSHDALDGKVFRMDDPFWDTFYPPNGFNCRCTVNTLTAEEVDASDRVVETGAGNITTETHISKSGVKSQYSVYTDQNGRKTKTDNGWNYNVGQTFYTPDFSNYTPSLVRSVYEPTAKKTAEKFTEKEVDEAIEYYVSGEGMILNRHLAGELNYDLPKSDLEAIEAIKQGTNAQTVKQKVLYRSVDAESVFGEITDSEYVDLRDALVFPENKNRYMLRAEEKFLKDINGKKIVEPRFMSTTKDKDIALEWEDFSGSSKPIVLELEVPRGIKGKDLEKFDVADDMQKEVLLSPDQEYEIKDVSGDNGTIYVKAKLINK